MRETEIKGDLKHSVRKKWKKIVILSKSNKAEMECRHVSSKLITEENNENSVRMGDEMCVWMEAPESKDKEPVYPLIFFFFYQITAGISSAVP